MLNKDFVVTERTQERSHIRTCKCQYVCCWERTKTKHKQSDVLCVRVQVTLLRNRSKFDEWTNWNSNLMQVLSSRKQNSKCILPSMFKMSMSRSLLIWIEMGGVLVVRGLKN